LLHPDEEITRSLGARLIILERPGFGLSDFQPGRRLLDWPDDVVEAADQLGLGCFAVVGPSGGGPYVAACAYKVPERLTVAAMVSSAGPVEMPGATEGMPRVRRAGAAIGRNTPGLLRPLRWLLQNPGRNPKRFFEQYTAHNLEPDRALLSTPQFREMLRASYAESARQGVRGFAWEVRIVSQPWGFRLEDIVMTVDLWHGDQDASTPLAIAQLMADALPNRRTHFLTGEGHLLLFSRWSELLSTLLSPP
jgi:pimeloyl-ACP methyl ester carboxylesterase